MRMVLSKRIPSEKKKDAATGGGGEDDEVAGAAASETEKKKVEEDKDKERWARLKKLKEVFRVKRKKVER